jgi:hypothetical protein
MTRWGTPKEYAWLYTASFTEQYRNMLLAALEFEGPVGLLALVMKELGREHRKRDSSAVQNEIPHR